MISSRRRRRLLLHAAAFAAILGNAGCGQRTVWNLPDGVMVDAPSRGKAVVGGIYAQTAATDPCCWVRRTSAFSVLKSEPATDFAVQLYLPPIKYFRAHPQSVSVTLDGKWHFTKCCYVSGTHTLLFSLAPELRARNGPVQVAMTMREEFVPARIGVGQDPRPLAAVFVAAEFRTY